MIAPLTFSQYIEHDYMQLESILLSKFDFQCEIEPRLKTLHSNIYKFKELIYTLELTSQAKVDFQETINGFIEFIWLLVIGKYKTSSMTLRGSMETFAKGLVNHNSLTPDSKFSQNIDVALKTIISNYCTEFYSGNNKTFSSIFGKIYRDQFKQIYWDLCDIVHSRDNMFDSCTEFLEDILEITFDKEKLSFLVNKAIKIVESSLIILLINEYSQINKEMNHLKLSQIIEDFSEDFHPIRFFLN